jgi:peptide/nickel transport system permease protein
MIPTVLGVILVTFILFNLVGGSPARMTLGEKASARALEDFDEQRGFNKPLLFGWRVATRAYSDHDLGRGPGPWAAVDGARHDEEGHLALDLTKITRVPLAFPLLPGVTYEWRVKHKAPESARFTESRFRFEAGGEHDFIGELARPGNEDGIGPSLALTIPILVLGLVLSIVLALFCAFFRGRLLDRVFVTGSVALMSVNYLVWIVAGQYLLGYKLGWFPVWGYASWYYLLLPVLIGVVSGLGADLRLYRTIMLDEIYKDYVRTAYAKGVGHVGVLFRHVLKNAMIPVITNVVLALPFLYTGSLLLESFFGIPGLGYLGISAINASDVDVVRALVVVGSISYLFANLLADVCYAVVDPRVKWS